MEKLRPMMQELTPERIASDGQGYLDFLAGAARGPFAITGYCMGARLGWSQPASRVARQRALLNRSTNFRAISATSCHPLSIVSECPRPGISTISVTPGLCCCLLPNSLYRRLALNAAPSSSSPKPPNATLSVAKRKSATRKTAMIVVCSTPAITSTTTPSPISTPPSAPEDPLAATPSTISAIAGSQPRRKTIPPIANEPVTPSPNAREAPRWSA